jgi:hypothetical protein
MANDREKELTNEKKISQAKLEDEWSKAMANDRETKIYTRKRKYDRQNGHRHSETERTSCGNLERQPVFYIRTETVQ